MVAEALHSCYELGQWNGCDMRSRKALARAPGLALILSLKISSPNRTFLLALGEPLRA
jgi:hypothetical protein